MHRDIGQPLVGARRPGRDGGFVARQRLVRAGRGDVGPDRSVQRRDHAPDVLHVQERVAPGRDRRDSGSGDRLRRTGAGHDQGIRHDQPSEVERVAEIAEYVGREARRPTRCVPRGERHECAHHAPHACPDRVLEERDVELLQLGSGRRDQWQGLV